jgi:hypothetical protein
MPRPSLVVVLVEDDRHRTLVYRYLRRLGLAPRQIRTRVSPSGQGSAERWIRVTYSSEVKEYRIRHAKAASALIVMTDADTHAVETRLKQLNEVLAEDGMLSADDTEQIVRLVPKRNVETWILCLNGQSVDEATDYKDTRDDWSRLIPPASEMMFRWSRPNALVPNLCVDSLRRGLGELNRLRF